MRLFSFDTTKGRAHRIAALLEPGRRLPAVAAALAALVAVPVLAQDTSAVKKAVDSQVAADKAAATSQNTINGLVDKTNEAANQYADAKTQADSLEAFNAQLADQVKSQEEEIASIQKQLTDIETTSREVQPLIERMVESLDHFVALDVPFFLDERKARVDELKELMKRADVAISEKYRKTLEAYQIELDYGSSFDSYQGRLGTGPDARTVQFVRLGRVSLMYQTLDGSETGYWDANKRDWQVDNSYADAVAQALKVATAGNSAELLTVPVPAPQEKKL
jgi:ABC-type transporter Mla subunit MlaD